MKHYYFQVVMRREQDHEIPAQYSWAVENLSGQTIDLI